MFSRSEKLHFQIKLFKLIIFMCVHLCFVDLQTSGTSRSFFQAFHFLWLCLFLRKTAAQCDIGGIGCSGVDSREIC